VASSFPINRARILVAATCSLVKLLRICVVLLSLLSKVDETLRCTQKQTNGAKVWKLD
jgi:hypothetical protein